MLEYYRMFSGFSYPHTSTRVCHIEEYEEHGFRLHGPLDYYTKMTANCHMVEYWPYAFRLQLSTIL
jgi:hypothetical protein